MDPFRVQPLRCPFWRYKRQLELLTSGVNVSELDEAWAQALAEAQQRARAAGRTDLSEYLALRASNDLLRQTSIEWLLTTFTKLAGKANRAGASIQISQQDAHRFPVGNATMVGRLLTLSNEELLLVRSEKDSPRWVVIEKTLQRRELFEAGIQKHLAKLLSESYR